jgi:hypothetical protein
LSWFFDRLHYFSLTNHLQKKVDAVAEHLAKGLNGRLERGGFWKGMPKVYVSRKNISGQVTFYNGGAKVPLFFTRFILYRVAQDDFRIHIYNEGVFSRLTKKLGMQDIEIGDTAFDKLFIIKSNDAASAKRLLDSKTRHSIKMLYQKPTIDEIAEVPDSVKRHVDDKGMDAAMKITGLLLAPSCPTFEMQLDKGGLCLKVFGLINQVEKARWLLDELMTIYTDWHLSRA